ncbi:hypothetical protein ACJW31_05G192600 [Castanea mollissima]
MIIYFAKAFLLLQTLLLFVFSQFGNSQDTITISKPIRDGHALVSNGETFALGFFRPGKSTNRYVGIWYNKAPEQPIVWVANRDNPINDTSGVLSIDAHGNLVLHAKDQIQPIWSTNIASKSSNNISTLAQLLDSGNLILIHNETTSSLVLWQSFDYPTDTTLPNMKLGLDRRTNLSRILTSWKSKDDPGTGTCSYVLNTNSSSPELYLYKSNILWWRSGHWNGIGWSGVPTLSSSNLLLNFSLVNNQNETTTSWGLRYTRLFSRLVVNESGSIQRFMGKEGDQQWAFLGSVPLDQCDIYGKCGAFGKCENVTDFACTCLPGFQPKSPSEWSSRNASSGCVRKRGQASICKSGDGFLKVENVKLPDSSFARVDEKLSLKECQQQCLKNCSCAAYGGVDVKEEVGCLRWYGELIDTRVLNGGQNLYVRVDALELDSHKLDGGRRKPDLPFFDISTILAATENFSPTKRLGQGGFGPVYKGQLANGQEIAVKTLSRSSRQGTEEFKNEVMLIAKLQHRNLVRLFGCCIHKEEKIDLKTSNVLLDAAMSPKISDFGLTRMFGDDQIEANTNRVVGTYGYMAPEYAMEGLYSTKSDVFSYGVLILEIISGKRNNHYHIASPCLNLIGHAWDLWMEGKALDIVDSSLGQAYPAHEISRCIQIGLLCVQEQATDRPTMVEIVFMLGNETTLSAPNKPAFINRKNINNGQDSSNSTGALGSINEVTISELEAR